MNKYAATASIVLSCLVSAAGAVQDPWAGWNTPGEVQDLLLAAAARDRLGSEYNNMLAAGRLSRGQQVDFLSFLGELEFRIADQCRKLVRQNPGKDFSRLPCPQGAAASAAELGAIDTESERTAEEAVAELDAELMSGLGQYDEMLLEEQKKIASRSPVRSQSGGWGRQSGSESGEMSGAEGSSGERRESRSGESGSETAEEEYGEEHEEDRQEGEQRSERTETRTSSASTGAAKNSKHAPPKDIPDGSDDDVVARQIREAAEKETDPKLRKKLWEEYRRYKTGRR